MKGKTILTMSTNTEITKQPLSIFIGAGASTALRLLTTTQIKAHHNLSFIEITGKSEQIAIGNFFSGARAYFKKQSDEDVDLEEVLSFLMIGCKKFENFVHSAAKVFGMSDQEVKHFLAGFPGLNLDLALRKAQGIFPYAIEAIHEKIRDHYSTINDQPAINGAQAAFEHYKGLVELIQKRIPVNTIIPWFTTNYDWVIEMACKGSGGKWVLVDGFPVGHEMRYDPKNFVIQPMPNATNIVLFKLHGSTSWRRYADDYDNVYKREAPPKHVPVGELAIVYPQLKIHNSKIRYYFFKTAYKYFEQSLKHSKILLIIGFSLRDDHVAKPLAEAIKQRPEFRVIYVTSSKNDETALDQLDNIIATERLRIEPNRWREARIRIAADFSSATCLTAIDEALTYCGF